MKAKDIREGGRYRMKVNGTVQTVRVDEIRENIQGRTVYEVTNLATGRKTSARSPSKFRGEVTA